MKILTHPATLALGLATLYLLTLIGPLVSPLHSAVYHFSGSSLILFAVPLINLFFLWLFLTWVFLSTEKTGWPRRAIWALIIFTLPWALLKNAVALGNWPLTHWVSIVIFFVPLTVFLAFLIFRTSATLPLFEQVRSFVAILLGFSALSGLILLFQLFWFAWQARDLNSPRPLHQQQPTFSDQTSKPRIIWLLLDELSYQQTYERRIPGLKLPAFDQIASQSSVFTRVIPAGILTERVIPSLFTGLLIDRVRASSAGQLVFRNASTNHWQSFDPHQTVFEDALDEGYSTGIVGWYNPYCRILAPVLDRCFWTYHDSPTGPLVDRPLSESILDPIRYAASVVKNLPLHRKSLSAVRYKYARLHTTDYRELSVAADGLLANSTSNFLFLHMPVPHPQGIYDRKTLSFTTGRSSYIDNLALADQYLAHVRVVLEQRGEWDSSTIIVMGDHSWRTKLLWSGSPDWTAEDQAASHGGQFDNRPGYVVKMPYQQKGVRIDQRFAAVRTRALLDGVMSHQLQSSNDLVRWIREQPEAQVASH